MHRKQRPNFRIWVKGSPKSFQKKGGLDRYKRKIREAAAEVVPQPTRSNRLDIEIFFVAEFSLRADVDNILKPILDALKGIVYEDDRQVRSVKATALPRNEPFGLDGPVGVDIINRLLRNEEEFLINVYSRFYSPGP